MLERWLGALSLTILFAGLATIAQMRPLAEPIDRVVAAGLMSRNSNGDFRADQPVNRAELARILVKALVLQPKPQRPSLPLPDVPPTHWAYDDIHVVVQHGLMATDRTGRFLPDCPVTQAEVLAALQAETHLLSNPSPVPPSDDLLPEPLKDFSLSIAQITDRQESRWLRRQDIALVLDDWLQAQATSPIQLN